MHHRMRAHKIVALGSWADEMDAQPLPAAGSGYSARNAQRGAGGDSREEGRAMATSAWERTAGGVGGGAPSGQRVAGFGKIVNIYGIMLRPY
jgi:hypothetical protein